MLEDVRTRFRRGTLGVGALAVVVWVAGKTDVSGVLVAVAALALVVDAKLTETDLLPWGEE
ncbi:hypothetical protein C440_05827 [Haloferax mucosum ATCC BAA-1512]|uniref:Uncharacterized protein n=1 Tax=Haloferax mucosum ATCC BAA-1512 TaxID=662479 RepID=M0IH38_9EURY|nr:hypothetical protein [Haloferax mucosum]ELZ96085.1 hypothetical protein C440_05827 [Haloferax mucosum ATCC BAA-1512]